MISESDNAASIFRSLTNRYYALRHGHSLANEAGIIVSDPEIGVHRFGLSDLGREQIEAAVCAMAHDLGGTETEHPLIVSSDFLRARETAQIVQQQFPTPVALRFDIRLRERFFGQWEGGSDAMYPTVWEEDLSAPDEPANGVESLDSVAQRGRSLIEEMEDRHSGRVAVLIAHGDILQILQCLFTGTAPRLHRSLPHLGTAEFRLLNHT